MVIKYRLSIIEVTKGYPDREVCSIGTFDSEETLIKWAEANKGELAKC